MLPRSDATVRHYFVVGRGVRLVERGQHEKCKGSCEKELHPRVTFPLRPSQLTEETQSESLYRATPPFSSPSPHQLREDGRISYKEPPRPSQDTYTYESIHQCNYRYHYYATLETNQTLIIECAVFRLPTILDQCKKKTKNLQINIF